MKYRITAVGFLAHIFIAGIAVLAILGTDYELKQTGISIAENKLWGTTTCYTINVTCGVDKHTYIDHCDLQGYYTLPGENRTVFEIDEFGEYTMDDVLSKYVTKFKCYYHSVNREDVIIEAPYISIAFLVYEYCFSIVLGIIGLYIFRYWVYKKYEEHFNPVSEEEWSKAVEFIWERQLYYDSLDFPFGVLIFLDMAFAMIIFLMMAFANIASLNHIYGFVPILLLGILGSFEKYETKNPFLTPTAKLHYVMANYAYSIAWSLTNIVSKIVLSSKDPFKDLFTYLVSIFAFTGYCIFKIYYTKNALNLFQLYYSNTMIEKKAERSK